MADKDGPQFYCRECGKFHVIGGCKLVKNVDVVKGVVKKPWVKPEVRVYRRVVEGTTQGTTLVDSGTTQAKSGTTRGTTPERKQDRWNERNRERFLGMKREYMRRWREDMKKMMEEGGHP